jgi:hypothetical protein
MAIQILRNNTSQQSFIYAETLVQLSEIYISGKQYAKAESLLTEAETIGKSKHFGGALKQNILENQAKLKKLQYKDTEKAFELLKQAYPQADAKDLMDSISAWQ